MHGSHFAPHPGKLLLLAALVLAGCGDGDGESVSAAAVDNEQASMSEPAAAMPSAPTEQPSDVTLGTAMAGSTLENEVATNPDGQATTALTPVSVEVTMDEIELALVSGDASVVGTHRRLEQAALDTLADAASLHDDVLHRLFELDANGEARLDGSSLTSIDWDPTHDAAALRATLGENRAFLTSNAVRNDSYDLQEITLGVLGERPRADRPGTRYVALGGNPFRNGYRNATNVNEQMHRLLVNTIDWLTDREADDVSTLNIVLAQLDQGYYFPDRVATREWLDDQLNGLVDYNAAGVCNGAALAGCLAGEVDLLIVSQHASDAAEVAPSTAAVRDALQRGIPVLYLHLDGGLLDLGAQLLSALDVGYVGDNYWRQQRLAAFDPRFDVPAESHDASALRTMLQHFRDESFAIDWATCDGENCNEVESLQRQFQDGADVARRRMNALDRAGTDVFATNRYRLDKLIALLGDHYRQAARFPMDRITTPDATFLRAFFADHAAYLSRDTVGVWGDLGNFSRTDFSHVVPTTRRIQLVSRKKFRSTGAYALPGQSVTVTRHDDSDVGVTVFVNTVRDGATRIFADDGYKRPRLLESARLPLASGQTIRFTSATGGPIQLGFDTNDLPVDVTFEQVGEHPHWRSAEDDIRFEALLEADTYDWAEIASPSFEIHSKRDKMLASIASDEYIGIGGSAQSLVDGTMTYLHDYPHILAGFQGPGIAIVDEIHDFATLNGLTVHELDLVKHMNADQSSCGSGCSGNPYDAYWSYSPLGHGDLHELGHGLERYRFLFDGWPGHAITNFYSYYSKTRYHRDTGGDPVCQSLPFEDLYAALAASLDQPDPAAYLASTLWSMIAWSEGAAMYLQMMMAAEDLGALDDGWHLLARLHLIERDYQRAIGSDAAWAELRAGLGMDQLDRPTARELPRGDWLVIALSHASGLDFRDYLTLWGQSFGDTAAAQVAAMGLPSVPRQFYVSSATGYCTGDGFDGNTLPLDGSGAAWPLP